MSGSDIMTGVNNLRAQNTTDFLDATKQLYYLNLAINYLNKSNKFFFAEKRATYAVSTGTTRFYLFSTLITDNDLKKIKVIRYNDDSLKDYPFVIGEDYVIEPDTTGGTGVRFIKDVSATIEMLYYAYIPKITDLSQTVDIPFEFNDFLIYKILEYVYLSQKKKDYARDMNSLSQEAYDEIVTNNFTQEETQVLGSSLYNTFY